MPRSSSWSVSSTANRQNQPASSTGLTVVRKSRAGARKRHSKIALVLAGGAITGGAFKLGALKALDDLLGERKTTDFDIYVGLSAGAFLAAPLAAGITPEPMLQTLGGSQDVSPPLDCVSSITRTSGSSPENPSTFSSTSSLTFLHGRSTL